MPDTTQPKHPGGRPTKYEPGFCDQVIDFMGQGFSLTAFAGHIGVNIDTCHEWRKVHPEFSDATRIAQAGRVEFLEVGLLSAKDGPTVTSRIFALKNAGPYEWRDKHEHEHGGVGGGPIQLVTGVVRADDQP